MPDSTPTDNTPLPIPPTEPSSAEIESGQLPNPIAPPPNEPVVPPSHSAPKTHKIKKLFLLLLILAIILIIASVILIATRTPKTKKTITTNTKKDIAVLNVGLQQDGGVPQYPINYSYSNDSIDINLQLFEGLVGYKDLTKVVPLLATNWNNPNDTTWVFNLRHDVKFHSGRTLTADDVKYSLDYAISRNSENSSSAYFVTSAIKQVTVTNPYQVTITTSSPDAVLLNQLAIIGIVDSKATLGDYNAGTGPYTVKSGTVPTKSSIDLAAFANYWGGHVYTREVKIKLYQDVDQLASDTANNKFDLAGYFSVSQLTKIKNYHPYNTEDLGLNYVGLNVNKTSSPLNTLAARQAVAYALNIPNILKISGLKGQQDGQIVPLILPGHDPSIQNTPYDPAKAKQLLSKVNNAAVPLTFAYPAGDESQVNEMAKELNAVGFNIKPVLVEDFDAFISDTLDGKYDLFTLSDTSASIDGRDILNDLLVDNQDYENTQIDKLLTDAGNTLNPTERIKDMQKVAAIVADEKPIIPLYTQTRLYILTKPYVIKNDLPGLNPGIYFWQSYQK
ncbi:MAG TPA: ABC transporter substrate-binding protein [Candidatus Saccharimonadales bacterium]|nr:ABC transporter substrate-binding protein [Candidatus Saccharimonadales bacterium]